MDCELKLSFFFFFFINSPDYDEKPNNTYMYVVCLVGNGVQVIRSVVVDVLDDAPTSLETTYLHNEADCIFGFDRNILWVDKDCGAMFNICLSILTCLGILRASQILQLYKCTFE